MYNYWCSLCCILLLRSLDDRCTLAFDDANRVRKGSGEVNIDENLRVLTFGMSSAWGAGLENRFDAYPYLLSSQVTNLAQRATGPNYPSVCTETMVGESVYDVIIIEYLYRAYDGVIPLAQRLRQRFPDATIIFLQIFDPKLTLFKKFSFDLWLSSLGVNEKSPKALQELEKTSKNDWAVNIRYIDECRSFAEEGAKKVNGYVLQGPPFPTSRYDDIDAKDLLINTTSLYGSDWFHLSKTGHEVVAQGIKEFLHTIKLKPTKSLGSWGEGDSCHNWFHTGDFNLDHSAGITMEKIKSDKFAAKIPRQGGYLVVENPFDTPRELVLIYMTTGPKTSIYPKTLVSIYCNNRNCLDGLYEPVTINPISDGYNFPVHVASSQNIGKVQPGNSTVYINPLQSTLAPFRIIAVAVIGGEHKISQDFIGMDKKNLN